MSAAEEALSPYYIGEQRIGLSLSVEYAATDLQAHSPVTVDIDATACEPEGLVPPLILTISGPSPQSYARRVISRIPTPSGTPGTPEYRPARVPIRVIEGGPHLVTLSEFAHNKWFGNLHLQVKGPLLTKQKPV